LSDLSGAEYLLVGASALTIYTGRSLWRAYASRQWPKAVGHVLKASADIGVIVPTDTDEPTYAKAAWEATFVYRYNVRGTPHVGSRRLTTAEDDKEPSIAECSFGCSD
jgi:hypothetical protein